MGVIWLFILAVATWEADVTVADERTLFLCVSLEQTFRRIKKLNVYLGSDEQDRRHTRAPLAAV
jgi:hypothetical protein